MPGGLDGGPGGPFFALRATKGKLGLVGVQFRVSVPGWPGGEGVPPPDSERGSCGQFFIPGLFGAAGFLAPLISGAKTSRTPLIRI